MQNQVGWGGYIRFVYMLVQVCVNCYVLISGYFLINSRFRLQKLIALWLEVVFYSVILKIIFMLTGYTTFSMVSLVSCVIPIFTGRYWFITIYFGLYLISPFLNQAIQAMNREQHLKLNIALFFLFSVMISVSPSFAGMNSGGGWGLAWFVVLYLLAAWFRLYYKPDGKVVKRLLGWLSIALLVAIIYELGGRVSIIRRVVENWYRYDSVPTYFMTVLIFMAFLNLKINNKNAGKIITTLAPATLGIYLIHAHANFSPWIWEVLDLPEKMRLMYFPIIQIIVVLSIFWLGALVDIIRGNTIGKIEKSKMIMGFCNFLTEKCMRFVSIFDKGNVYDK